MDNYFAKPTFVVSSNSLYLCRAGNGMKSVRSQCALHSAEIPFGASATLDSSITSDRQAVGFYSVGLTCGISSYRLPHLTQQFFPGHVAIMVLVDVALQA
jgi:hypothetical protein